jgi:hypothetical protein
LIPSRLALVPALLLIGLPAIAQEDPAALDGGVDDTPAELDGGVGTAEPDAGAEDGDGGPIVAAAEADAGAASAPVEPEPEQEVDPASDPPPAAAPLPDSEPRTRVTGRLRSEMFMSQRARMRSLGDGRYGVHYANVYPFYETIELRADEIGHPGLSVHFQGWAGLDLADVYFDQRFVADPTYLYLQFRHRGFDFKAGRQLVFTGPSHGLHLDGLLASYEFPIHLGIEALGGLVVSPYRGPEWYRERPAVGHDDFGAGFTDWERDSEYALGGRIFYRRAGVVSAGVSGLRVTELGEADRVLLGLDLDLTPVRWLGLGGNASFDMYWYGVREANFSVDLFPVEQLGLSVEYRHADPSRLLSHISIFSVFASQQYHSVGGTAHVEPIDWLAFHAGYHQRFYRYLVPAEGSTGTDGEYDHSVDAGYDLGGGSSFRFGENLMLFDYRRLTDPNTGLHQLRLGMIAPLFVDGLRCSMNGYLDLYDDAYNGADRGVLVDIGLFWFGDAIEIGGSFSSAVTPYARSEQRGMLKLVYNFEIAFFEEHAP